MTPEERRQRAEAAFSRIVERITTEPLHAWWGSLGEPGRRLAADREGSTPLVLGALAHPHPQVRRWAAMFLPSLGLAPEPLLPLLNDPDRDVCLIACRALATRYPAAAAPALHRLLREGVPYQVREALDLLIAVDLPDTPTVLREMAERGELAADLAAAGLSRAGPGGRQELIALLESSDPLVRQHASLHLGFSGGAEAVGPLLERLDDPDPRVRAWAILSLGRLKAAEAEPRVLEALASGDERERAMAVKALADLGSERGFTAILGRVADESAQVRGEAIDALAGFPPSDASEDALLAALAAETDPSPRLRIVFALAAVGGPSVVPTLESFLRGEVPRLTKRRRKDAQRRLPALIAQARERGS